MLSVEAPMQELLVGLFCILAGAVFCFAGYRFFLLLLPLWGLVFGFSLGAEAIAALFGTGFLATTTGWLTGVIVGLIFAVASYLFYWAAVVILGAAFGAELGSGLMALLGIHTGWLVVPVAIVGAAIVAWLTIALNLPKLLIVVLTALGGSSTLIAGFLLWAGRLSVSDLGYGPAFAAIRDSSFWALVWLGLALSGLAVQSRSMHSYALVNASAPL
jgi:hypothetical protein